MTFLAGGTENRTGIYYHNQYLAVDGIQYAGILYGDAEYFRGCV